MRRARRLGCASRPRSSAPSRARRSRPPSVCSSNIEGTLMARSRQAGDTDRQRSPTSVQALRQCRNSELPRGGQPPCARPPGGCSLSPRSPRPPPCWPANETPPLGPASGRRLAAEKTGNQLGFRDPSGTVSTYSTNGALDTGERLPIDPIRQLHQEAVVGPQAEQIAQVAAEAARPLNARGPLAPLTPDYEQRRAGAVLPTEHDVGAELLVVEAAGVVGDDRVRHVATREVCGARRGGQLLHVAVGPLRDERLGVYLQRRAGRDAGRQLEVDLRAHVDAAGPPAVAPPRVDPEVRHDRSAVVAVQARPGREV